MMIVDSTVNVSRVRIGAVGSSLTCDRRSPRPDQFLVQHVPHRLEEEEARKIRWLITKSV
jgi:hypothetical protein